jgi:hypothetical protein
MENHREPSESHHREKSRDIYGSPLFQSLKTLIHPSPIHHKNKQGLNLNSLLVLFSIYNKIHIS